MGLNDKPALVNILIKKGIKSRHIIVTLLKQLMRLIKCCPFSDRAV